MTKNLTSKCEKKYYCEMCDFGSNNKADFNLHNLTGKHKRLKMTKNANANSQNHANNKFTCECGKVYKHQSSLCKHKQKCEFKKDDIKGLIVKIMKENSEKMNFLMNENQDLRNQLKEQNEQITQLIPKVGNNNNNNNNLKQKFNINLFLNEKCKDALSMDEFIDKIEISMKNLLTTKEKGQAEGISNIIIENMNKLSLYERPLHCTDKKRETLYIKNNEWEKDENNMLISKALKKVESMQLKNVQRWIDEHPNYMNNVDEQAEFIKLINESSKSQEENREKVIKNICTKVFLEKD
jgi:hypothetical protein